MTMRRVNAESAFNRRRASSVGLLAMVSLLLTTSGCGQESPPEIPVRAAGQTGDDAAAIASSGKVSQEPEPGDETGGDEKTVRRKLTGVAFDVPRDWNELPESQYYEAKYTIPSDDGQMTLTLTTMGGGIEPNLQRWVGQFRQEPGERPRRETLRVDGTESQWLDVRGTFQAGVGSSPGPHDNWRLLGVAIPMKPRPFLLKLVGPRAAVSSFEDEFRTFVRSGQMDR